MKPYSILMVRGQARRLRSMAWKAHQQYALDVASLRLVTNDFTVFSGWILSMGEN